MLEIKTFGDWLRSLSNKQLSLVLCSQGLSRLKWGYTQSTLGIEEWLAMPYDEEVIKAYFYELFM